MAKQNERNKYNKVFLTYAKVLVLKYCASWEPFELGIYSLHTAHVPN